MIEQPRRGRGGKAPKTVYLKVGIFANEKTGQIHITSPSNFITTVNNIPGRKRCHPHLYGKLRDVLQREGKWPQEDGSA